MRHLRLPALLAVAFLALSGCGAEGERVVRAAKGNATVVAITDGDTLRVRISGVEERVRLIGIDTPETHGRGGLRECFGAEATERLKKLVPPGTSVRLGVNLAMARDGYAAALTIPPNVTHADAFRDAVAEAREAGRGLWSACGGPDTALETGQ